MSVTALFAVALVLFIGLAFEMIAPILYGVALAFSLLVCIVLHDLIINHFRKLTNASEWNRLINLGKYVSRRAAIAMYLMYFVICAALIVTAIVIDPIIVKLNYFAYAAICASLSGCMVGSIYFGYKGLKSMRVCKKCGAVNALVLDESLEYVTAVGYEKYNLPGLLPSRSYTLYIRKGTKSTSRVACHCARCGSNAVVNEDEEANWYWV